MILTAQASRKDKGMWQIHRLASHRNHPRKSRITQAQQKGWHPWKSPSSSPSLQESMNPGLMNKRSCRQTFLLLSHTRQAATRASAEQCNLFVSQSCFLNNNSLGFCSLLGLFGVFQVVKAFCINLFCLFMLLIQKQALSRLRCCKLRLFSLLLFKLFNCKLASWTQLPNPAPAGLSAAEPLVTKF